MADEGFRDEGFDLGRDGGVGVAEFSVAAGGSGLGHGFLASLGVDVGNDGVSSFFGEEKGRGAADSGGSAGDDCHLSFKLANHSLVHS